MKRVLALSLLLLACTSRPSREEASVSGKPTLGGDSSGHTVELRVSVEEGPSDLESGILLNNVLLNCLRQGLDPADTSFSVSLAGRLNAVGEVESALVTGPGAALRDCLTSALKPLKFAAGEAGPFRLTLRRAAGPGKGKTLVIDLGALKKFE